MASPEVVKDVRLYGFNLLNIANNHMLDYSHCGLEATLKYLKQYDFKYAGIGLNLSEASSPTYIECDSRQCI